MLPPRDRPSLPLIPHLPRVLQLLVNHHLANPRARSDHLLLLADACDELTPEGETDMWPPLPDGAHHAIRTLAAELRRRAPAYA